MSSITSLFLISLTTLVSGLSSKPPDRFARIIDGDVAVPHSIPFQVGMFTTISGQKEKGFCGGSLLNNIFVLTAAHCISGITEAHVILGAHKINEWENTQQRFTSRGFIIHRKWNPSTLDNDIGMVRLPNPAKFTPAIQPVRLPALSDKDKSFTFSTATISGWGLTENGGTSISPILRQMQSKVTLHVICKVFYLGKIGPNQMCVDGYHGRSTCSGDSGGPLVIPDHSGRPVLQGVVSYGIAFGCDKRWPQVFTKVSGYLSWIYEHTGIEVVP